MLVRIRMKRHTMLLTVQHVGLIDKVNLDRIEMVHSKCRNIEIQENVNKET